MGNEHKKIIVPYRYMPFDLGTSINDVIEDKLTSYFKDNDYQIYEDKALLSVFSKYYK